MKIAALNRVKIKKGLNNFLKEKALEPSNSKKFEAARFVFEGKDHLSIIVLCKLGRSESETIRLLLDLCSHAKKLSKQKKKK